MTILDRLGAAAKVLTEVEAEPQPNAAPWFLGDLVAPAAPAYKALSVVIHNEPSSPWYYDDRSAFYNTEIDYKAEAGSAASNSIVMAAIGWIVNTFPEAPLKVMRRTADGMDAVPDHNLTALIEVPNEYYSGQDLWDAMLTDYNIGGNGYWLALLNSGGRAVELWYEPSFSIQSVGSENEFISKWQLYRKGEWLSLNPREVRVVHFRDGIDPRHPRLGISDLAAAYREMYTDNEAARYTAALMRNMGIPGVIISPDGDQVLTQADADEVKRGYIAKTTGDKRGEPVVLTKKTNVQKLAFSPAEMDMGALRTIPEERISALLGVPAIVAGLGAGLDAATYSNFKSAERKGWTGNIIPAHRRFAAALQVQLLPLCGDPNRERVTFDHSQVAALQEDATAIYERANIGYGGGFLTRNEARRMTNWEMLDEEIGDVFAGARAALPPPEPVKLYYLPAPARKALPPAPDDELVPVYTNGNGAHEEVTE